MKDKLLRLRKNKIAFLVTIFSVLLIVISLGTAIISSSLNIGGKAKIKENSWIIYFDKVRKSTDSVESDFDAKIVDLAKTRIEFEADLKEPGDFYEFTVYTVNDGTIDAMIESIVKKELTEEQEKYLDFEVTYDSGEDLEYCDPLDAGTRRKIKAIVRFKDNVDLDDYPKEDTHLELFFDINYVQKEDCGKEVEEKNILTILPDGGKYNGRTDETRVYMLKNDIYNVSLPTREMYNFAGWEFVVPTENGDYEVIDITGNEDYQLVNTNKETTDLTKAKYVFTMGSSDVYIRAKWDENDYVARIENTYYTTIQDAFDSVDNGWKDNTVWLLKNTVEYPTNNANDAFIFNLDGHTVTGTIENSVNSDITMVNGRVEAEPDHEAAFINYGNLNLGINDGLVEVENSIALVGNDIGLLNQDDSTFYFYDGYLEGITGLVGGYTGKADNHFVFADHRNETNTEKVYLVRDPSRAVAKILTGGEIYYYNLQDAINASDSNKKRTETVDDSQYIIYAIRSFEAAYELSVEESSRIIFDTVGFNIKIGDKVTNDGYFKIYDSDDSISNIEISQTIDNNGTLEIEKINITISTDYDAILNKGNLKLSKVIVQAKKAYGVNNIQKGTVTLDEDTVLKSEDSYGLHNSGSNLNITAGTIYGFYNEGTAVVSGKTKYITFKKKTQPSSYIEYIPAIRNTGTLTMNDGIVETTLDTNMIINSGTFNFNDGKIYSEHTSVYNNSGTFNVNGSEVASKRTAISNGKIVVNGGNVKSETANAVTGANIEVKKGEVYTENGVAINGQSTVTVSGGTVKGTTYAVDTSNYSTTFTITDGLVEAPTAVKVTNAIVKGGTVKGTNGIDIEEEQEECSTDKRPEEESEEETDTDVEDDNQLEDIPQITTYGIITSNLTMEGGNVLSTNGIGILINRNGLITGGYIKGSIYGVQSNNELTIGEDDEKLSITIPEIVGGFYGLYINGETTNFYDGILKGQVYGYKGEITGTPLGGVVSEGDETINCKRYKTNFIVIFEDWLRIENAEYNTLNAASQAIKDGESAIIIVKKDADITFAQKVIDENKNKQITLDLNGHKVSTTQSITNYSNLTIIDSSIDETREPEEDAGEGPGTLIGLKHSAIVNEKLLTINSGRFECTVTDLITNNSEMIVNKGTFSVSGNAITNKSNLTINNIDIIKSNNGISSTGGTVVMNDGYINSDNNGIVDGAVTMNGGKIEAINSGIYGPSYNGSGHVILNNGEIVAQNSYAVYRAYWSNITIKDGRYESVNNIAIKGTYHITMSGGTVIGTRGIEDGAFTDAINQLHFGDTTITGGKIYGTSSYGVNILYGTLYVYEESYIQGATDGIYNKSATVQLGKDEGSISKTNPIVVGENYGVNSSGTFRFFDGIIKGRKKEEESNSAHNGIVTLIPDATMVKQDFEFIDSVLYDTEYLETLKDWLEVDGKTYNSINAAQAAIESEGTMNVIADVHISFEQSMPSGKNITFNLNGHSVTLTQPIITSATTKFVDEDFSYPTTDEQKNLGHGSLHNVRTDTLINRGTMVVEGGNYSTDDGSAISNSGQLTLNNGNFHSEDGYTINNSKTLIYEAGVLTSKNSYAVYNDGTFNMNHGQINTYGGVNNRGTFILNDGIIEGTDTLSVNNSKGTTKIIGGEVINKVTNAISSPCGTVYIEGGKVTSTKTNAITLGYTYSCGSGHVNVSGGEVTGETNGIVHTSTGNIITVSGGQITGKTNNGINVSNVANITGGIIEGGSYGVYVSGGTTTIGENDETISIDSPVLKGGLYGLYFADGIVNFYDGILKGKTYGNYRDVTNIPDRSDVVHGDEMINDELYQTTYLYTESEIVKNIRTGKIYDNLQESFNEALDEDELQLIANVQLYYQASNKKKLTLDMNGHSISANKHFVNSGNLTIVNKSDEEAIIKSSTTNYLINNSGTLNISNVTLQNMSASNYVLYSTKELTLSNVNINSINGVNNTGKLNISNSNFKTTKTAINNTGDLTVDKGVYTGTSYSIYSNSSKTIKLTGEITTDKDGKKVSSDLVLNGIFYNSGNSTGSASGIELNGNLQNTTSTLTVSNSIIKSGINGSISNTGNLTIDNVDFYSNSGSSSTSTIYNAITNSKTMNIKASNIYVDKESSVRNTVNGIYNSSTLNISEDTILNVGLESRKAGYFRGIYNYNSGKCNIKDSILNIAGGNTNYGIYVDNNNASAVLETGRINVSEATTTYGVYINLGTFNLGAYDPNEEDKGVSHDNPYIYSTSTSKGIGVKKLNGSFNFYDGAIWSSKYSKPETTTGVRYHYEVTTYVDEYTGFEYSWLEYMLNDYEGTAVAKVGDTHFETVQSAIDYVTDGQEIILVRSTTEDLVVKSNQNVKINLGNHSITTHLVNNGTLQVYNGSLQNFDAITVENYGKFIMGDDDGTVSSTNTRIVSETTPLVNNGTFEMYDGYLEGNPSIEGNIDKIAPSSRIYTTRNAQSERKYLQSLSEEAIKNGETELILTIDPDGGLYQDSKDKKIVYLKYQQEHTLDTPTKNACIFDGWEATDDVLLEDKKTVKIDVNDVTVTAKWIVSEEAKVKVGNEYYTTLKEALSNAKENDLVELIKDIEEDVINYSNVTIDLGGHTFTGEFVNEGILKLINGTIYNPNGVGLVNKKSLTLGENDGNVEENSIKIIGKDIGLKQEGKFNFYDGQIEGAVALVGSTDSVPKGYFIYTDKNKENNYQRAYLIGNPENAVAVIEDGETQYFFSLQDAIDSAAISKKEIYIARDFEASYPVEVEEGYEIVINIDGYNITTGDQITNNGKLTIYDTSENPGSITSARTIINNNDLTIKDIKIKQNTSNNAIDNNGTLDLQNSIVEAKAGYAVSTSGKFSMDATSSLLSSSYALYNNQSETLVLNNGTIHGINNINDLELDGDVVISSTGTINGINLSKANSSLVMKNGTVNSENYGINISSNNTNVEIYDGNITSTSYGIYISSATNTVLIDGGEITSQNNYAIYNSYSANSTSTYRTNLTINGGIITGKTNGLNLYATSLYINGGEIKTIATSQSNYAIYFLSNCSATMTNGKINAPSASGIYLNNTFNMSGGEIHSGLSNGYGINLYNGTLNLKGGTITTTGASSYGIYGNRLTLTVNMTDGEIISNNVGIYVTEYSGYARTLNIYSGKISGNTYGINQNSASSTTNIGRTTDEESNDNPYVTGGLYGLYKSSGKINFYNGRLRGSVKGYNADFDSIKTAKEITTVYETDESVNGIKTFSTTDVSDEPTEDYAKSGNGSAHITYIDEDNTCSDFVNQTFDYINGEDVFNVPCNGKYRLEVWGAQGGSYGSNPGGYGGYSTGEIILSENDVLYINVGGQGSTTSNSANLQVLGGYNGGGAGFNSTSSGRYSGSGGGATSISTEPGTIAMLEDKQDKIVIVAGGGAGFWYRSTSVKTNTAGSGGGYIGGTGTGTSTSVKGATQTEGYSFGKAEDIEGKEQPGAGGGYYGGYSSTYVASGGSGYIGNPKLSNAYMYGYNVPTTVNGWINNYLVDKEKFLEVDDEQFSSLQDAEEAIEESGTIRLLKDAEISDISTFTAGKNITLDLEGHVLTMTQPIKNNSNLIITDSSNGKTGKILSTKNNTIENSGNLTISGAKIESSSYAIYTSSGTGTVKLEKNAYINGTNGIYLVALQTLNIDDSEINVSTYAIHIVGNNVTVTLNNSELTSTGNTAIYNSYNSNTNSSYRSSITIDNSTITGAVNGVNLQTTNLTLNSGEIKTTASSQSNYAVYLSSYNTFIMNDGKVSAENASGIYTYSGQATIKNGEVYSGLSNGYGVNLHGNGLTIEGGKIHTIGTSSYGIYSNRYASTINIKDGEIISNNIGIYVSQYNTSYNYTRTLNIYGGTVKGKKYGISQGNSGTTINIGNVNEPLSQDVPLISGGTYGIYKTEGNMNFYNGKLRGTTQGYTDEFNIVREKMTIYSTEETEIVDDEEIKYVVNYLTERESFLAVDNEPYNSINDAVAAINNEGTIIVVNDGILNEASSIPEGKDITIDLNGNTLSITQPITNSGNLTIKDSTGNEGKLESTKGNTILNDGDITIENGTIKSASTVIYANSGTGTITLGENSLLEGNIGIYFNSAQKLIMNGGKIETTSQGIYIYSNSVNLNITGGIIKSNSQGIYNYSNASKTTINITNGTITSASSNGLENAYSTSSSAYKANITIDNSEITGATNGIQVYGTNLNINGGEVITTASSQSNYALNCQIYSNCKLNNGAKITAENASGIYVYTNLTLDETEIYSGLRNGHGIYAYNATITINDKAKIITIGQSSYGVYSDRYATTINMNGGEIISENVGVYLGNYNSNFDYARKINVYDGKIYGETYAIQETSSNSTVTIGNLDEETVSNTKPVIEGRLYGIYKTEGTLNFYNGILKGETRPYYGDFTNIRVDYEVYETSENVEESGLSTELATTYSAEAQSQAAKEGNGYARITYLGDDTNCLVSKDFDYSEEGEQTFVVPCTGIYKLEVWGAQGGNANTTYLGGYGGYTSGEISLNQNDTLYINVGGQGSLARNSTAAGGYNGGGSAITSSTSYYAGSGGGATHIATSSGLLSELSNDKESIIMVAGGGGGGFANSTNYTSLGASGGGFRGALASYVACNSTFYKGVAASQTSPGTNSGCGLSSGTLAEFGKGGSYTSYSSGGGGGYYGGGFGYRTGGNGGAGYNSNPRVSNTKMYTYNGYIKYSNGDTNVAYLIKTEDIIQNIDKNQKYSNMQTAFTEATAGDRLQLIKDVTISYETINENEVTLDLNGFDLKTTKTITNNDKLTIVNSKNEDKDSNIYTTVSTTLFENNGELIINNVNLSAYIAISNKISNALTLENVNITSSNRAIVNEGIMTIDNSDITGTNYAIYSNTVGTNSIKRSKLSSTSNALYKYSTSTTTVENTDIIGNINNSNSSGELNITGGTIVGVITNAGKSQIKGANISYTYNPTSNSQMINNSGTMTLEENELNYVYTTNSSLTNRVIYNTSTLKSSKNKYIINNTSKGSNNTRYSSSIGIHNTGLLTSTSDEFESHNSNIGYAIYHNSSNTTNISNIIVNLHDNTESRALYNNNGEMIVSNADIDIIDSTTTNAIYVASGKVQINNANIDSINSTTANGLYLTSGTINSKEINVNIESKTTGRGAYITDGTLTIENGTLSAKSTTAYGVQMSKGTLNLGIADGDGTESELVSQTDPHVEGIGTTTGIGVSMGNGTFNFYDGYITGSTSARGENDITTGSDKNYQIKCYPTSEEKNSYCMPEYIH